MIKIKIKINLENRMKKNIYIKLTQFNPLNLRVV